MFIRVGGWGHETRVKEQLDHLENESNRIELNWVDSSTNIMHHYSIIVTESKIASTACLAVDAKHATVSWRLPFTRIVHASIDWRPRSSSSLNPEQFLEAMAKPGTDTGQPTCTCFCLLSCNSHRTQLACANCSANKHCPVHINSGRVELTTFCFSNKLTKKSPLGTRKFASGFRQSKPETAGWTRTHWTRAHSFRPKTKWKSRSRFLRKELNKS